MNQSKNDITSTVVFVFSGSIIAFSLISIVFPALLVRATSGAGLAPINPFEPGLFAVPLLVINTIFLILYFSYNRNYLPEIFYKITNSIANFDVSSRIGLAILFSMIAIYAGMSYGEIFEAEIWPDYETVLEDFYQWNFEGELGTSINQLHSKMFLLSISAVLFDNLRVLPFLGSISLLILTYFFTVQLASKRISGLIAIAIVLQSNIFLQFDTTATYSNFWVVFYLLSLYLVKKGWPFSSLGFVASFFAKPLTFAYLPLSIFHIVRSQLSNKKKILTLLPYFLIITVGVFVLIMAEESDLSPGKFSFHPPRFFSGFSILPYQLRSDLFIMMLLFPLILLLYKKSRQGQKYAQSLQVLVAGIILSGPLLTGFFDYLLNPYRLVPLIVFFSIGFGLLFGKNHFSRINCQ